MRQILGKHMLICCLFFNSSLLLAEEDWSLYGNNYQNHRHSPLKQLTRDSIEDLKLTWRYHTGIKASFQATPIVVDGVMYLSTPFNDVLALQADNGQPLWRYQHQRKAGKTCCGPANRGVAVHDGKVFQATIDGRFLALDQVSGDVLWDIPVLDQKVDIEGSLDLPAGATAEIFKNSRVRGDSGHSFNMAPQVYQDKVFVGSTGAGYGLHLDTEKGLSVVGMSDDQTGLRGFLAAFDTHSGKELWRWYSVPGPEWVGQWQKTTVAGDALNRDIEAEQSRHESLPNSWQLGGGSIWTTPAIDTETGWLFIGTGNPSPNMEDSSRPGDNLHTSSIVAIDSATGELMWAFQQVPHDRWGYDVSSPPVLFELDYQGKKIPALGQAGKTGWFYVLDRRTGELLFKSEPFVPQSNLFAQPTEDGTTISPAILGGVGWSPVAIDPVKQHVFIPAIHQPATYYQMPLEGNNNTLWDHYSYFEFSPQRWGTLTAINLKDGNILWQHKSRLPLVGGALHTEGGLVFSGEGDGEFFALDATSGEKVWSYRSQYGVNAPPISFSVKGKQYIAVLAGGNKIAGYPVGDEVLVFSLEKETSSTAVKKAETMQ